MKKFLSLFLAVIMVLAISIPAFATETGSFKIGDTYFDTLLEAVKAANDGDTIEMVADFTMEFNAQTPIQITKSITIDGGNHTLTLVAGAANQFAILVNGADKNVTIKNFAEINATVGGGITVGTGTLDLENVIVTAKGRAAVKTQGGGAQKAINVKNSTIRMSPDASNTEATMILSGDQASTLTLNSGAIVEKASAANTLIRTQSAVIYYHNNGNHSIVMNEGSKIIAKQKSGTATTVIGLGDSATGKNKLTVNDGAYLVVETTVPTVHFISANVTGNTDVTVPAGAFLVKEGISVLLPDFSDNGMMYIYEECASAVAGYKAYSLAENTNVDYNFEIINGTTVTKNAGTIGDAISAAPNGSIIKLLKDHDTTATGINVSGKSITIDLNDFTLNATGAGYFIGSLKSGLTIMNGTFKVARGIIVQDGGHLSFENATAISSDGTGSNSRAIVKLNGTGATKLTIKNSTVETKTTIGEPFILVEQKTNGTIDIVGNSVLKYSGNLGNNNQNHATIAVQTSANLVLNVGAEANVIAAHASSTKEKIASVLADQSDGNITVNLDAGATIAADRTYAEDNASTTAFFLTMNAAGTMTVNNDGANFVVSPDVAKQGIALPVAPFGYQIGDAEITLAEGNVYQNAEATETVTIETVFYTFKPTMIPGAAIRLELPFGLRFGATIDEASYNKILALDPNAEFGFAIAKKGDAGAKFDTTAMLESKYVLQKATVAETADGVYTFMTSVYVGEDSVIKTDDEDGFKTNVAAKAYIKATINGEEVFYWADYKMSENSRSLFKVAEAYYADAENGATDNIVINYIIAVCEAK